MRPIDADELIEWVYREDLDTREKIAHLVERQPTVRNEGTWTNMHTTCSKCGWQMIDDVLQTPNMVFFNYCPYCGAKMKNPVH